jgi:hypothetical protein
MTSPSGPALLPVEHISRSIRILRGRRVLLDTELAVLYGVTTKRFNEQVRRNRERFPADFMFQLSVEEGDALRSQIATSKATGRGGRRYLPYAFTEDGAIMAATVLNSPRATEMTVYVVRAFVKLREILGLEQGAGPPPRSAGSAPDEAHRARSSHRCHPLRAS